ncbi:MAG: carboxypeptidase regulatory-like domain-containing protein [Betaproteobacteria bacterium]|nr:carboxypeptidase regulatory-like domain-containing protein [Betaproteobacteria bacterium]
MSLITPCARRITALALLLFSLAGCGGGGGGGGSAPGTLGGTVTDAVSAATLAGVRVVVFNADTNAPVGGALTTDAAGKFSVSLTPGNYAIKLAKQGYDPVPPASLAPVPFTIASGQTTTNNVQMTASANAATTGAIQGAISAGSTGVAGVLVAAEAAGVAYSALSDASGHYAIYNVPAASYTVKGYVAGYTVTPGAATVTAGATATANLAIGAVATGQVPATFNLISATGVTPPANMIMSLVHPVTRESIPGLSLSKAYAPSLSYSFAGVADATYLVRATYANDTIVVDPDSIVKFGEPSVVVAGGAPTPAQVAIKATSAVGLTSPTNALTSTVPVSVAASPAPVFTWAAYPSSTDYVIEVMDAATGTVIWGGFGSAGGQPVKNITIPSATTSIDFNSDGNATAALVSGRIYRWRIYASKNNVQSPTGWSLISASEDQLGLIKIQ